jgi:hypothetical protein
MSPKALAVRYWDERFFYKEVRYRSSQSCLSERGGHVSEFADKVALPSVSTCLIDTPYSDMLVQIHMSHSDPWTCSSQLTYRTPTCSSQWGLTPACSSSTIRPYVLQLSTCDICISIPIPPSLDAYHQHVPRRSTCVCVFPASTRYHQNADTFPEHPSGQS